MVGGRGGSAVGKGKSAASAGLELSAESSINATNDRTRYSNFRATIVQPTGIFTL